MATCVPLIAPYGPPLAPYWPSMFYTVVRMNYFRSQYLIKSINQSTPQALIFFRLQNYPLGGLMFQTLMALSKHVKLVFSQFCDFRWKKLNCKNVCDQIRYFYFFWKIPPTEFAGNIFKTCVLCHTCPKLVFTNSKLMFCAILDQNMGLRKRVFPKQMLSNI